MSEPEKPADPEPAVAAPIPETPTPTPEAPAPELPVEQVAAFPEAIVRDERSGLIVPARVGPNPATAALEAARLVSTMVDIDTQEGAMIAAAAAASAAVEVARDEQPAEGPVTTVRLSRDRILRALAEDQAQHTPPIRARTEPGPSDRAPSQPGDRAPSQPGTRAPSDPPPDEYVPQEFDPVQIAAAAIQRLRKRARTDLAELRVHYHRHDILVLLLAFVIIVMAGHVHSGMVTPPNVRFDKHGLQFEHSQAWLKAETPPLPSPRLARDPAGGRVPVTKPPEDDKSIGTLFHTELTSSVDPTARIEVLIDKKPTWSNVVAGLELDRRTRWGELYTIDDSSVRGISGHDWLRTAYRYAHAFEKGDVPRVDRAVEYATVDRDQIYVVTIFGSEPELVRMEEVIAPSLAVPTPVGLQLVPQTGKLSQRTFPNAVARAFDSTVMIVLADLIDGRLMPRGGGAGVIVGGDGSILTNFHILIDDNARLHDVFVIGRFADRDRAPELWCAGKPSRGKLQREVDLALLKCDLDLDGRAWTPVSGGVWATLPEARASDIVMGQRLWVLGYPDVGGGGLTLSQGDVEGWTGENGAQGNDYLKTDASITHGNSGGPVVDDQGRLVGVASAFRKQANAAGKLMETHQAGLVRPLSSASLLLAIAAAGWTPREGHTEVEIQPSAVEAPAEGIRLSTHVVDEANDRPVLDALVMVLKPGVSATAVDMNRLDDQVLSWGRTNSAGEVQLKQPVPVPGTYTVMVVARGYEPLIGENELHLDASSPPYFDPWGKIWLRSR